MPSSTTLSDLIGIEHCKLGFYHELQNTIEQLRSSNLELEKRRQEMQAVLDGITDLMVVISEDMRIHRVNHVFKQWYPDSDPESGYCYEILRNNSTICEGCPVLKALENNQVIKDLAIIKIGGKNRQFEIIASPLKADSTGERQVLLFKRDVTLEKEYQAQFYQAEKMATVGTLAAGVAHEINNPLTAISGFAEGLKRRVAKLESGLPQQDQLEDFIQYTDIIMKECSRCKEIVQTLLSFSRPVAATLRPVDLNQCVIDTLFILKHHFKDQPNLNVIKELSKDLPHISGDESQLKQVIINLLTNAVDATADGGEIKIITKVLDESRVSLAVGDTGIGIEAKEVDKLFEPFFTTKPVGKGVGIGLSTCYSIVKSHHGEISVESTVGEGTTFLVTLPTIENEHC